MDSEVRPPVRRDEKFPYLYVCTIIFILVSISLAIYDQWFAAIAFGLMSAIVAMCACATSKSTNRNRIAEPQRHNLSADYYITIRSPGGHPVPLRELNAAMLMASSRMADQPPSYSSVVYQDGASDSEKTLGVDNPEVLQDDVTDGLPSYEVAISIEDSLSGSRF